MLNRDAIGCIGQVNGRKFTVNGSSASHFPIRVLVFKTDHTERHVEVIPDQAFLQVPSNWHSKRLLHILHAGWLNGNYSWRLERLGNEYNPDGLLVPGFRIVRTLRYLPIADRWESMLHKWKHSLQAPSPTGVGPLGVTPQVIRCSTRTVLSSNAAAVNMIVNSRNNTTEKE